MGFNNLGVDKEMTHNKRTQILSGLINLKEKK